jgi:antirestriction protein
VTTAYKHAVEEGVEYHHEEKLEKARVEPAKEELRGENMSEEEFEQQLSDENPAVMKATAD